MSRGLQIFLASKNMISFSLFPFFISLRFIKHLLLKVNLFWFSITNCCFREGSISQTFRLQPSGDIKLYGREDWVFYYKFIYDPYLRNHDFPNFYPQKKIENLILPFMQRHCWTPYKYSVLPFT